MKARAHFAAVTLAALFALPGLACGAPAPSQPLTQEQQALLGALMNAVAQAAPLPVADAGNAAPQEIIDAALVDTARKDFGKGDYAKLEPHIPALAQLMSHAPESYPATASFGSTLVVRNASPQICLQLESGQVKINPASVGNVAFDKVRCAPNTYADAAFMLGLYYDQKRTPQQGLSALDQGLKLQPTNLDLAGERFAALRLLNRNEDVLTFSNAILARPNLPAAYKGLVLRHRGGALVELGRLDEGQAAYEASLVVAPNHPLAQNELKYIAQLRAGRPATPAQLIPAGQAATPGLPALYDPPVGTRAATGQ